MSQHTTNSNLGRSEDQTRGEAVQEQELNTENARTPSSPSLVSGDSEPCLICYEEIQGSSDSCTRCNNRFHSECIVEWSYHSDNYPPSCPTWYALFISPIALATLILCSRCSGQFLSTAPSRDHVLTALYGSDGVAFDQRRAAQRARWFRNFRERVQREEDIFYDRMSQEEAQARAAARAIWYPMVYTSETCGVCHEMLRGSTYTCRECNGHMHTRCLTAHHVLQFDGQVPLTCPICSRHHREYTHTLSHPPRPRPATRERQSTDDALETCPICHDTMGNMTVYCRHCIHRLHHRCLTDYTMIQSEPRWPPPCPVW
jgi:hypothetical protein